MELTSFIKIEKIYSDIDEHLTEIVKHEKRHYKAIKDKEFIIRLKFMDEEFLKYNYLKVDLLHDIIEKGYPQVENTKRMIDANYMETTKGSAIIKVIIHSITRSNQSIPYRILITSLPFNNNNNNNNNNNLTQNLPLNNYSVMTDPIIVISKVPNPNKKKQINTTSTTLNNTATPNLEEISKNIQKMMEMLQNQATVLQKVTTTLENPKPVETVYYQIEEPLKKKQRAQDMEDDPYNLGQEPLQASICNLIDQYKQVPTKDKKQKRLRQLLFDLQNEDQNLIKEFAEDVLDIFNNNVTLQPNPPPFSQNNFPSSYLEHLLFSSLGSIDTDNQFSSLPNQENYPSNLNFPF